MVDLIAMKGIVWDEEDSGVTYRDISIPEEYREQAHIYREKLFEKLSLIDDQFMELYLEGGPIDEALIHEVLRKGTIALKCVPVVLGTALKNKGIQPLMDAVVRYLPSPLDVPPVAGGKPRDRVRRSIALGEMMRISPPWRLRSSCRKGRKLVYVRVYSGVVKVGDDILNVNLNKKEKISRIFRMHANHREHIEEARTGAIVGMVGLKETSTGHTLTGAKP